MFQASKADHSFSGQRKWNAASQKWLSPSTRSIIMRTKKIKLGKRQLPVSGLFRKEGWRFSGGLPSGYFDALFEYALTCGERERREVTSRKFSGGEAGGWVLPLAGGRATRAASCHHTGSPPLLANRSQGWIDWRYFLQWGKQLSRGSYSPLQTPHAVFSTSSTLPALLALAAMLERWYSPKSAQAHLTRLPDSLFVLCLWSAVPPTSRDAHTHPRTHLCAEEGEKSPFPGACPCAVASWTRGDPCREHVISRLIKRGLQSQGSFVSCHTDLSFKAQRRKKKKPNLWFKTWRKNWLKLNLPSRPFIGTD